MSTASPADGTSSDADIDLGVVDGGVHLAVAVHVADARLLLVAAFRVLLGDVLESDTLLDARFDDVAPLQGLVPVQQHITCGGNRLKHVAPQ